MSTSGRAWDAIGRELARRHPGTTWRFVPASCVESAEHSVAQDLDGPPPREWMKNPAAARYLGVSERTIDNWRRDLGLPSWTISRCVRFDRAELDAWVAREAGR